MQLSKSDYLLYLKHPAWLWLKKNEPRRLPKPDAALQAVFDAGYLFESYAEKLFPGGIKLNWEGYQQYLDLPMRTNEAILSGAKTIFQGRLVAGEITCIFDVIQFVGKNTVDLFEIKSSTEVRTYHEHDLAFQTVVLEDCGYTVRNIAVVHVNKEYVRQGEVKAEEITHVDDVTKHVKARLKPTRENIAEALEVAKAKEMPNPSPAVCGLNCTNEWLDIYKDLKGIKNGDGSIFDIYHPKAELIAKLEEAGIEKLKDIPEDFEGLSDKQREQLVAIHKKQITINKVKIGKFLAKLEYPLYFLDYETLSSVVPYFDGHKPFQQVPFQYSLHIIEAPGAELKHVEYLHGENSDPTVPLSKSLQENIGTDGTVLVWWESFEKGRNDAMGQMLPEFRQFYRQLNARVVDLIEPFFKFYYVDARFGGSASIKDVLPVIAPDLSYKDLDIQEGNSAQRLWMEAVLDEKHPEHKEKILKDLWKYCKLDTLAMVRIWEFLEKLEPKQPTLL
jgi:hypothetical protein